MSRDRNARNICRSGFLAAIFVGATSVATFFVKAVAKATPTNVNREQKLAPAIHLVVPRHQRGFSLIEIIVGMVITAIALTSLTALLYPQFVRGVDPIFQIRAAELGQALAEEILGKAFDENSPVGGNPPCSSGLPGAVACGAIGDEEGGVRGNYDDVDDYNAYCQGFFNVIDQNGTDLTAVNGIYATFRMRICVTYDDTYNGANSNSGSIAKRITVDIFPPSAGQPQAVTPITFVFYRSNF
jgi:MSHA pilin protein MshD